jgi:nucleotide exchange factor SIL1
MILCSCCQCHEKSIVRSRCGIFGWNNYVLCFLIIFPALLLSANVVGCHIFVTSTEVVATEEWTLLGGNDTVDAGVHVRMDLSTGEKWVKTVNDAHDSTTSTGSHAVTTTLSLPRVDSQHQKQKQQQQQQQQQHQQQYPSSSHDDIEITHASYDYEMMHRTLSRLPEDELVRMGLPERPQKIQITYHETNTSPELLEKKQQQAQAEYERKMRLIWDSRQQQLQQWEKEFLADLPALLQERLTVLNQYITSPMSHFVTPSHDSHHNQEKYNATAVMEALIDLEYQLSDIDMARDFFTLGGWSALVSLISYNTQDPYFLVRNESAVSPSTKQTNQSIANKGLIRPFSGWSKIFSKRQMNGSNDITLLSHIRNQVSRIQALAAWVLGTAIKNTEEFQLHPLEEVVILPLHSSEPLITNAVEVIHREYARVVEQVLADQSSNQEFDDAIFQLQKLIYALGAMMRGNRLIQIHYVINLDGSLSLRLSVEHLLALTKSLSNEKDLNAIWKVIQRLLALVDDIVSDVVLHPTDIHHHLNIESDQVDNILVQSLTVGTDHVGRWCDVILEALQESTTQSTSSAAAMRTGETALQAIHTIAPSCSQSALGQTQTQESSLEYLWHPDTVKTAIENLSSKWIADVEKTDAEHLQERLDLVDKTLRRVGLHL